MTRTFILIAGKAGVGKTTLANMLLECLNNANVFSVIKPFATGVKNTAKVMGWDGKKDQKGRRLLQTIGMGGRDYDENIWVKYLLEFLPLEDETDITICDDWRFPTESEYLENLGHRVYRIRVSAPEREILKGTAEYEDRSETSLPDEPNPVFYDAFVDNSNISLSDLAFIVESVADEFLMNFLEEEINK